MRAGLFLLLLLGSLARGATPPEDDDAAALALPVTAPAVDGNARVGSLVVEAALTSASLRSGGSEQAERLSFDGRDDWTLTAGLRFVAADLLDLNWQREFDQGQATNTFKEGYLSWQPKADVILDAGRINARQGVALGYNPTDFFRADALRTVDSLDPDSLRENRLGTVMLRGQTLWDSGAITASFAPKIESSPSSGAFDPDFGATNHNDRWMLALSQRLTGDFTPQFLVFGGNASSTQVGLNLTHVMGTATVAYLEASAGHQPSLFALAGNTANDAALRARAAAGFTYSAPNKLSLTLEYEYNGAALGRAAWNSVRYRDLPGYGRYRNLATDLQDTATEHNAFVYASWADVGVRHLDITAFLRLDLVDKSKLPWAEARYHWTKWDVAIRWQNFIGAATSDYGASPQGQTLQAVVSYYL